MSAPDQAQRRQVLQTGLLCDLRAMDLVTLRKVPCQTMAAKARHPK